MKIYAPNREFSEFLNFMATKRHAFNDWRFISIFQINKTGGDFPYEDVLRFIDTFLPEDRPVTVLLLKSSRQMLLIGDNQNTEAFYEIEKRVPVSFRALNIHQNKRVPTLIARGNFCPSHTTANLNKLGFILLERTLYQ